MKRKRVIFLSALIAGLLIGIIITSRFNLSPTIDADTEKITVKRGAADNSSGQYYADSLEGSFIRVAEEVGPAVVSISTEHVARIRGGMYESPFGRDEFFDRFFRDFFSEMPEREFTQFGLGSGAIIDKSGYILTNEHVIRDADKITVTLTDGREFEGKIRGKDERSDLAVIEIEADDLPIVRLGDSDKARIGQWAIAIGNPFGYTVQSSKPTLTVGVVSALDRSIPVSMGRGRDYSGLIQTDAAINPGNSGGPLVNIKGEMIGINVAIFSTTGGYQGVGFAIPINAAKEILNALIEGRKVLYGWLGVSVQDIDDTLAGYFSLPDKEGVIIAKVVPDSPAQTGGLKEGDVVRRFDGEKVKDLKSLLQIVSRTEVGKNVTIRVVRDKKEIPVSVKIGERPTETGDIRQEPASEKIWRGLEISNITAEIVSSYRIGQMSGIIVTNTESGSPAQEAGIKPGDTIDMINNKPVNNADEYYSIVSSTKGDALIRTSRGFTVIKEPKSD
ncbi:MAG: Do family serine endopeptidase [Dehalococcoidia bacterium]|nr:MAG: Do family serine endopeptidase [Dehalococcoidia bacterium]